MADHSVHREDGASDSDAGWVAEADVSPAPAHAPAYGARTVARVNVPGEIELEVVQPMDRNGIGTARDRDGLNYLLNKDTVLVGFRPHPAKRQKFMASVTRAHFVVRAVAVS